MKQTLTFEPAGGHESNEHASELCMGRTLSGPLVVELSATAFSARTVIAHLGSPEHAPSHASGWLLLTRKLSFTETPTHTSKQVKEGTLTEQEALLRIPANRMDFFLHPTLDPKAEKVCQGELAEGVPSCGFTIGDRSK